MGPGGPWGELAIASNLRLCFPITPTVSLSLLLFPSLVSVGCFVLRSSANVRYLVWSSRLSVLSSYHRRLPGPSDAYARSVDRIRYFSLQHHGFVSLVAVCTGHILAVSDAHWHVLARDWSAPTPTVIHPYRDIRLPLPSGRPPLLLSTGLSRAAKARPSLPRRCELPRRRFHARCCYR